MAHIIVPGRTVGIAESPYIAQPRQQNTVGEAATRALSSLSATAEKIAKKQQNRMNIANVQNATSKLYDFQNNALYGKDGLYTVKGANAMGKTDQIMHEYQNQVDTIMKDMKNPAQQQAFQSQALSMRNSIKTRAMQYETQQNQDYQQQQHTAIIAQAQNAAVTGYQTPGEVGKQINTIDQTIRLNGDMNGESPEAVNLRLKQAHSKVYSSVLSQMITDGNYLGAQQYFKAHSSEFLANDKATAQAHLQVGTVRGKSQEYADSIMGKGIAESDALAEARQIKDPQIRDETVRRVQSRYATDAMLLKQQQVQNYQSIADQIEQGKSTDSIDPAKWLMLTPGQRNTMLSREKQIRSGMQPTTNWKIYTRLMTEGAKLADENLYDYRDKLADSQYNAVLREQQSAIASNKAHNGKMTTGLSFNQMVLDHAQSIGMVPTTSQSHWGSDDAKNYADFREEVNLEMQAYQESTGKKATPKDIRDIMNRLAVSKVTIPSGHFYSKDTTKYPFQVQIDNRGKAYVKIDNIATTTKNQIKNKLMSKGIDPSNDLIEQIAGAYAMGDKARALQLYEGK